MSGWARRAFIGQAAGAACFGATAQADPGAGAALRVQAQCSHPRTVPLQPAMAPAPGAVLR
jgi:hypothetical protein